MILVIRDKEEYDKNSKFIEQFRKIYNDAFPDENEREELTSIYNRLDNESTPFTFLIFDLKDDIIQGGLIIDVYIESEFAHLIYIVTDPNVRQQGVARRLLKEYLPKVLQQINKEKNTNIENIIFESNNPELTTIDSFDTKLRLDIFKKLDAKYIPIKYIQPPLEGRTQTVHNLFLFVYTPHDSIDSQKLKKFIGDFYYGLGIHNYVENDDYIATIKSIDANAKNNQIFLI